jgi:hypothetical protein
MDSGPDVRRPPFASTAALHRQTAYLQDLPSLTCPFPPTTNTSPPINLAIGMSFNRLKESPLAGTQTNRLRNVENVPATLFPLPASYNNDNCIMSRQKIITWLHHSVSRATWVACIIAGDSRRTEQCYRYCRSSWYGVGKAPGFAYAVEQAVLCVISC